MSRHWMIPLAMLWALSAAQAPRFYEDVTGNIEVFASSGRLVVKSNFTYRFEVTHSSLVHAVVHDQGLDLYAKSIQGEVFAPAEKMAAIRWAAASGGVRVVKSGSGARSEISGAKATFTQAQGTGRVVVTGSVKLVNYSAAKNQTLIATGSSAEALFAAGGASKTPIRTATLRGPVAISGKQHVSEKEMRDVHVKAARLDLDNTVQPAKLTLSGGVDATGFFGHMSGNKAVMTVNEQGEITSLEVVRK